MVRKTFVINGVTRNILVDENETLATFLRERLLLTGCKIGCGEGHCGACNVIVNGKVTRSCLTKLGKIKDGAEITTIEGIGTLSDLHPLQVAWMTHGCAQCGFCSPRLHHDLQGTAGQQSLSYPGGSPRLVPEEPEPVPLHRL